MKPKTNSHLKNLKEDPLPSKILCDTSFFVALIVDDKSHRHRVAKRFAKRLRKEKVVIAVSSIIFSEFWRAAVNIVFTQALGKIVVTKIIKEKPGLLKQYTTKISVLIGFFFAALKQFHSVIYIHPNIDIIKRGLSLQNKFLLDVNDAIHTASILYGRENNIVSFDSDFERITNCNIWCRYSINK